MTKKEVKEIIDNFDNLPVVNQNAIKVTAIYNCLCEQVKTLYETAQLFVADKDAIPTDLYDKLIDVSEGLAEFTKEYRKHVINVIEIYNHQADKKED